MSNTIYANTRASRVCRLYGCVSDAFYAARCLMKESPLTCVSFLWMFSVIIFGHALRICESPNNDVLGDVNFDSYYNCWWNIIITMTTVGYGDIFARTILGRIIIFIVAIWGVFVNSLLTVALTVFVKMEDSEIKVLKIMHKLDERQQWKSELDLMVKSQVKLFKLHKNGGYIN